MIGLIGPGLFLNLFQSTDYKNGWFFISSIEL